MQETWVRSLGQEDPLEKKMATYSSIFAWEIPWTEEPGWLQSMGSQRVRHNWSNLARTCTQLHIMYFIFMSLVAYIFGFPWWFSGKEFACQCRRWQFDPWVRKIPWRRKWQPTPVFLSGKSQGERSLVGYGPWGCKESEMTKQLIHE